MIDQSKQKKLLIALAGIVVVTIALYLWYRSDSSFSGLPGDNLPLQPSSTLSPNIIKEEAMQVFKDESFLQLEPQGEVPSVDKEDKGRPNPFQP